MIADRPSRQWRAAMRREAFCRHYIITLNAAEAARRAGYAAGAQAERARRQGRMGDDGAKVIGCRLLANPEIRARIGELLVKAYSNALGANSLAAADR